MTGEMISGHEFTILRRDGTSFPCSSCMPRPSFVKAILWVERDCDRYHGTQMGGGGASFDQEATGICHPFESCRNLPGKPLQISRIGS